jgi:hypothetical protein
LPAGPHDFATLLQGWMQGGQGQQGGAPGFLGPPVQEPGVGAPGGVPPQFLGPPVHQPPVHPPNYLGPPVHGSGDHSSQYPVFWSAMQGLMDHVAKQYRDVRPPKAYRG